jgi:hypothetical protein
MRTYSGMWRHIAPYILAEVSEEEIASTFMVEYARQTTHIDIGGNRPVIPT